jgi:hypothetical protein
MVCQFCGIGELDLFLTQYSSLKIVPREERSNRSIYTPEIPLNPPDSRGTLRRLLSPPFLGGIWP